MKITIPAVIDKKGRLSAALFLDENGKEHQDVGLLWDDMPEDVPTTRIDIVCDIDIEAIFKAFTIKANVQ